MTAARESANSNRIRREPMVAILDATDVAQAGRMVLIMDMLLNLSEVPGSAFNPTLNCSETCALLALGARLFNGDRVAASLLTSLR
jgi:hypothetical protein